MSSNKRTSGDDIDPSLQQPRKKTASSSVHMKHNVLFSLVFQQQGFLHWSDALALSRTCKDAQMMWKESKKTHFSPLLELLESMVGDVDEDDPGGGQCLRQQLDKNYKSFSIAKKCETMVAFLQIMVGNMKNFNFCLEDPSNSAKNKECNIDCMSMGFEYEWVDDFMKEHTHRSTLAMNIAIFDFALSVMEQGGDYYFNDVFLGMEGAYLGGGSCYGLTICGYMSRMLPLRDEDLVNHMRATYPSLKKLELLGPVLTSKVVLMAPFFRWVPPNDDKDDGIVWFEDLPTPLEAMNENSIRSHGMGQFLEPHEGMSY
eukprot:scaffold29037_cov52-Attheya_sp.AAC.2